MKALWPSLFAIGTASLSLGLLEASLDLRGADRFVRPYHYAGTLITVILVVSVFWVLFRRLGWLRRRGAFLLSIVFLVLFLSAWSFTLPLGDRVAVHYQRLDPEQSVGEPPGYGWFYGDDSGSGGVPMSVGYLVWSIWRPWLPMMFLGFFPCFFFLYRNSTQTGNA